MRQPVAAQPAKELRAGPEADREQEQQEEALLDVVRAAVIAELADEHAREQRSGHRAELEAAEGDLSEQVAEAENEEERDLGMSMQQIPCERRRGHSPVRATAGAGVSNPPPSAR